MSRLQHTHRHSSSLSQNQRRTPSLSRLCGIGFIALVVGSVLFSSYCPWASDPRSDQGNSCLDQTPVEPLAPPSGIESPHTPRTAVAADAWHAEYDFEDSTIGEHPSGSNFQVLEPVDAGYVEVADLGDDQNQVVKFVKESGSGYPTLLDNLDPEEEHYYTGEVSCKVSKANKDAGFDIILQNNTHYFAWLQFYNEIRRNTAISPAFTYESIQAYDVDTWYNVTMYYNLAKGWMVSIDGVLYGNNYAFSFTNQPVAYLGGVTVVKWRTFQGTGLGESFLDDVSITMRPETAPSPQAGWQETEVLSTVGTSTSNSPVVASDTLGNTFTVWSDGVYAGSGGGKEILYKIWNGTTETWSGVGRITNAAGDDLEPDAAVDSAGNLHVVWEAQSRIYYSVRNGTTGSLSSPIAVSRVEGTTAHSPSVTADSLGNVHVVWILDSAGTHYRKWTNETNTWDPEPGTVIWAGSPLVDTDICADHNDDVHVVWTTYWEIYYKIWNATTKVWSPPYIIDSECSSTSGTPYLTVAPSGEVCMTWRDATDLYGAGTNTDVFFKYRKLTTGGWTYADVVTIESGASSYYPSVAIDSQGRIHVVYVKDNRIYYTYKNDFSETLWAIPVEIFPEGDGSSSNVWLSVDSKDNLHVVWHDTTDYQGSGTDCDVFHRVLIQVPQTPILDPIIPDPDYDGSVTLNWSAIRGAENYSVFRDMTPIPSVEGRAPTQVVETNSWIDAGLTDATYHYVVVAGNAAGNSTPSGELSVTVQLLDPPAAPTLDPITPDPDYDGTVALNWTDVAGATTYYVYRALAPIGGITGLQPVQTVGTNCTTDAGLTDATYHYVVVAGNPAGNSTPSGERSVTVQLLDPPAAPTLDPITPDPDYDGTVALNWTDVPGATAYHVYRALAPIGGVTGLQPVQTVLTNYTTDAGLTDATYHYVVVAGNAAGNSTPSGEQSVQVTLNQDPIISHPADIAREFGGPSILLAWTVTDAVCPTPTYQIFLNGTTHAGAAWTSGSEITFTATNLPVGFHNFTIIIADGLGRETRDTVWVHVFNLVPGLTSPGDLLYTPGTTPPPNITWVPTDASVSGPTYTILVNGSMRESGTWTPGEDIVFDLAGLEEFPVGKGAGKASRHAWINVTVIVSDGLGGETSDEVWVVVPVTQPSNGDVQGYPVYMVIIPLGLPSLLWLIRKKSSNKRKQGQ